MKKATIPQSCKDERCPLSPWHSVNNNVCLRHASCVADHSEPFAFKLILVLLQCQLVRTNSDMLLLLLLLYGKTNYKEAIK